MREFLEQSFVDWQKTLRQRKTVTEFAAHLGVPRDVFNAWMNGRRRPNEENVALLAAKLGKGIYAVAGYEHLDPDVQHLAREWQSLTPGQREALLGMMSGFRQGEPDASRKASTDTV